MKTENHSENSNSSVPRQLIYFLVDTSGSMHGEPIHSVTANLQTIISTLKQDAFALDSVFISIITFDRDVKLLTSLIALKNFSIPEIELPESGPTNLGAALKFLYQSYDSDIIKADNDRKGDYKPLLFIFTDGHISDIAAYKMMIPEVQRRRFAKIIACGAGPKFKKDDLKLIADNIITLETADNSTFRALFNWGSETAEATENENITAYSDSNIIQPPQPENPIVK